MGYRRPAAHFLDLDQIKHVSDTAWDLAVTDRRAWGNALRVQAQIATGLRVAELHNLRPNDLHANGTVTVRRGKGCKPRKTVFLDGGAQSETLALVRRYIAGEGRARGNNKTTPNPCRPEEPIFQTSPRAYSHFVRNRLGPASGLQRRVEVLVPGEGKRPVKRYLVHTHLFRACFVILARRLPRRHEDATCHACAWTATFPAGCSPTACPRCTAPVVAARKKPIAWETIAFWLGHDSADMTRKRYWYADEDEMLSELAVSIPAGAMPRPAAAFTPWGRQ